MEHAYHSSLWCSKRPKSKVVLINPFVFDLFLHSNFKIKLEIWFQKSQGTSTPLLYTWSIFPKRKMPDRRFWSKRRVNLRLRYCCESETLRHSTLGVYFAVYWSNCFFYIFSVSLRGILFSCLILRNTRSFDFCLILLLYVNPARSWVSLQSRFRWHQAMNIKFKSA